MQGHEYNKSDEEKQPEKKQRVESKGEVVIKSKVEEKSVDKLIEAELEELKDKSKVSFKIF